MSKDSFTNTDIVTNNTFWIGVHPALPREMFEIAASKIEDDMDLGF